MWNIFGSKNFRWKTVGLNEIPCNSCYFSRMGDLGGLRKQIHQHLSFEQPQVFPRCLIFRKQEAEILHIAVNTSFLATSLWKSCHFQDSLQYLSTLGQIRPVLHHFWCSVHLCHKNSLNHILSPHFQYFESFPESKPLLSSPLSRTPRKQRDKRVRSRDWGIIEAAFLE